MARQVITNGESGLDTRTAINSMTAELYAVMPHPGYVAGRSYILPIVGSSVAGATASAGLIRLVPFLLPAPITLSEIGVRISAGATGGLAQGALYNADATTHLPTTLVAASGSFSTTTTGNIFAAVSGGNVAVGAGFYWAAINQDTVAAVTTTYQSPTFTGASSLIGSATKANLSNASTSSTLNFTFTQSFGTWPDLTGQTFTQDTNVRGVLIYGTAA